MAREEVRRRKVNINVETRSWKPIMLRYDSFSSFKTMVYKYNGCIPFSFCHGIGKMNQSPLAKDIWCQDARLTKALTQREIPLSYFVYNEKNALLRLVYDGIFVLKLQYSRVHNYSGVKRCVWEKILTKKYNGVGNVKYLSDKYEPSPGDVTFSDWLIMMESMDKVICDVEIPTPLRTRFLNSYYESEFEDLSIASEYPRGRLETPLITDSCAVARAVYKGDRIGSFQSYFPHMLVKPPDYTAAYLPLSFTPRRNYFWYPPTFKPQEVEFNVVYKWIVTYGSEQDAYAMALDFEQYARKGYELLVLQKSSETTQPVRKNGNVWFATTKDFDGIPTGVQAFMDSRSDYYSGLIIQAAAATGTHLITHNPIITTEYQNAKKAEGGYMWLGISNESCKNMRNIAKYLLDKCKI
jgi:hypothetical protein